MKEVLHKNESRGLADHGWLISRHSFSFSNYHNPQRMNFGLLRVLNDDIVKPGKGFGTHPHDNMEIISIPLYGSLRHEDSMGNRHIVSAGEVQVMSAGSGLTHSEYNNSDNEDMNFLQIWIQPKEKNIPPRYGQMRFDRAGRQNCFQTLVAPEESPRTIRINQDAWLSMAELTAATSIEYQRQRQDSGVYFFIVTGTLDIAGNTLDQRDGLALTAGGNISIEAQSDAEVLAIEIPLN